MNTYMRKTGFAAASFVLGMSAIACGSSRPVPFYSAPGAGGAGSSGGQPASGGAVAAGGTPTSGCTNTSVAKGSSPLITDFEGLSTANLNSISSPDGYSGGLYSYTDNTGTVAFEIGSPGYNSNQAVVLRHTDYTSWGAGLGFWFTNCYDASVYAGITFAAKGTSNPVWVTLANPEEMGVKDGGTCPDPCSAKPPTAKSFTPGADWATYQFHWSDFDPAIDPKRLHNINLNVSRRDPNTTETAEFWMDDVQFLPH